MKKRCQWGTTNPLLLEYHDTEWGVPVYDDRKIFEFFVLDTFQAGLSWLTILKKRKNFKAAFDNFDYVKISRYDDEKINELLNDEGIIRNRLKINATINNAQRFLDVQKEFGSFDKYIWSFVGGKPIIYQRQSMKDLPVTTSESDSMSKDLKKRGFKFVGSTTCYAFMQAAGMVNDHETGCFRYGEICDLIKSSS